MSSTPLSTFSLRSTPESGHSSPEIHGRHLVSLIDSLTTSVHKLQGITREDLMKPREDESPDVRTLREIIVLTKTTMIQMNQNHLGLPPDTLDRTLDLVGCPGSHTIVLRGIDPRERDREPRVLGYGIVIQGKENFPDPEHFSQDILTEQSACRVIRLFVTETARSLLMHEAFSKIIEEVKRIGTPGPVLGLVLTDIVSKDEFSSRSNKEPWLVARRALEARGFEDTGELVSETIRYPNGGEVVVCFRPYVWPPISENGQKALAAHEKRFLELELKSQERIASVATALPVVDGIVLVSGRPTHAHEIARAFPGDLVFGASYNEDLSKPLRKITYGNLNIREGDRHGDMVPTESCDAALVLGILPDIAGVSLAKARHHISTYLANQVRQLKYGGMLVVRDTVATEGARTVRVTLESKGVKGDGSDSSASNFKRFIANPVEGHIPEGDWKRIWPVKSETEGTESFLLPRSVLEEFKAKMSHPESWGKERARLRTILTASERLELILKSGTRLYYDGPEQSAGINARDFDGKIALSDLHGRTLTLPPTNHITIAEKVKRGEGVRYIEASTETLEKGKYVEVVSYIERDSTTNEVKGIREIASRPDLTLDVVPYSIVKGRPIFRANIRSRPIIESATASVDGSITGPYLVEQLTALAPGIDKGGAVTLKAEGLRVLKTRGGIDAEEVLKFHKAVKRFTEPSAFDEENHSIAVEIKDGFLEDKIIESCGPDGSSTKVRSFDGIRFLQGVHQDARLELKIYEVIQFHGLSAGPWLGNAPQLSPQAIDVPICRDIETLLTHPSKSRFEIIEGRRSEFHTVHRGLFEELDQSGNKISEVSLEYVTPDKKSGFGSALSSFLPVIRAKKVHGGTELLVGIEMRDLPIVQKHGGHFALPTVPTFRMPSTTSSLLDLKRFTKDEMSRLFNVTVKDVDLQRKKYRPTIGITPDAIYPTIGEVDASRSKRMDTLTWVPLSLLWNNLSRLQCCQLATAVARAAHAYGIIDRKTSTADVEYVKDPDDTNNFKDHLPGGIYRRDRELCESTKRAQVQQLQADLDRLAAEMGIDTVAISAQLRDQGSRIMESIRYTQAHLDEAEDAPGMKGAEASALQAERERTETLRLLLPLYFAMRKLGYSYHQLVS